jgi:hypothetical protein
MPLGANKVALYGASADTGSAVLLSTATASSSSSIEFTLPTSYKQVNFQFVGIHPSTTAAFMFQASTDGASYGVTTTNTYFRAYHTQNDSTATLGYTTSRDLAQSTSNITIGFDLGQGNNDESASGCLTLFNPKSTTYVKHYNSRTSLQQDTNAAFDGYLGGYFNTTSALASVKFLMDTGNIDEGTIKMWGIK